MKTLLVNTCLRPTSEKIIFPIGIGYIATAMENAGHDFDILDLDSTRLGVNYDTGTVDWDVVKNEMGRMGPYDAVAMGTIVTGYRQTKETARAAREVFGPEIPIIVGNTVASSIPETLMAKTEATYGVMGEGDITIVDLLDTIRDRGDPRGVPGIFYRDQKGIAYSNQRPVIQKEGKKFVDSLDVLPHIKYDLLDMDTYLEKCKLNVTEPYPGGMTLDQIIALPLNTARGCPFACTFCYFSTSELSSKEGRYRTRSIEDVCSEIGELQKDYGVNHIQLFDELTLYNSAQADRFAQGILDALSSGVVKPFYWNADCRGDLLKDDAKGLATAKKLKEAGCQHLSYSLESGDPSILSHMDKRIDVPTFIAQSHVLHKAGVMPTTSIIIGYPEETPETIAKTYKVLEEAQIIPSVGKLQVQPGTPMYNEAIQRGIIRKGVDGEEEYLFKMGDRQEFRVNFTEMEDQQVLDLIKMHNIRIRERLGVDTDGGSMMTGHYKQPKIWIQPTKPLEAL